MYPDFQTLMNLATEAACGRLMLADARPITCPMTPCCAGVYLIVYDGVIVYVGSAKNLSSRFSQHHAKLCEAAKINPALAEVKYLPTDHFAELTIEKRLISAMKAAWNNTGFGNNALGKNRRYQTLCRWDIAHGRRARSEAPASPPSFDGLARVG